MMTADEAAGLVFLAILTLALVVLLLLVFVVLILILKRLTRVEAGVEAARIAGLDARTVRIETATTALGERLARIEGGLTRPPKI